jgi:hypothetical protein
MPEPKPFPSVLEQETKPYLLLLTQEIKWAPVFSKYKFVSCIPSSRVDKIQRRIFAMLKCNFVPTLRSFGDKIQGHSDPTLKSLLGILRDLRIIVDVLANMNQSSR